MKKRGSHLSQVINGLGTRAVSLSYPLGITLRPTPLLSTVKQAPVMHTGQSSPSSSDPMLKSLTSTRSDRLPEKKGGFKRLFE